MRTNAQRHAPRDARGKLMLVVLQPQDDVDKMNFDLIDRIVAQAKRERGHSDKHAHETQHRLKRFALWLGRPVETLTVADVNDYFGTLGLAPGGLHRHLQTLKMMAKALWREERFPDRQLMLLSDIKFRTTPYDPRPYTGREIAEMWRSLDTIRPWMPNADVRAHLRTYSRALYWLDRWRDGRCGYQKVRPMVRRLQAELYLALGLYGGLRAGEVRKLTVTDAHYDNAYILVHGAAKGGTRPEDKIRKVPFNAPLRQAMYLWLEMRELLPVEHDGLLVGTNFQPLTDTSMRVNQHGILVGGEPLVYHRLRHTFATMQLRANRESGKMPIEYLAKILGHSSIEMTLRYAKIAEDDLFFAAQQNEEAFLRLVPREASRA